MPLIDQFVNVDKVKTTIVHVNKLFKIDYEKQSKIKFDLLKDRFEDCYNNNKFYRNLCLEKDVSPEDVKTINDISKFPLLPTSHFKGKDESFKILTKDDNSAKYFVTSSGTNGLVSYSRRDKNSAENNILNLMALYTELFSEIRNFGIGLYLAPAINELPSMGAIRLFHWHVSSFSESKFISEGFEFDPKEVIKIVEGRGNKPCNILAMPYQILDLIEYLRENNLRINIGKDAAIMTAGGWKRHMSREVTKTIFRELCVEYLGASEKNIRDLYAMAESGIAILEDENHNMMVPPWAHVSIRNPENVDEEMPLGEPGRLAVYDPIIQSYPSFILTNDTAYVEEGKWGERYGQRFTFVGRDHVLSGSCALSLEKKAANN